MLSCSTRLHLRRRVKESRPQKPAWKQLCSIAAWSSVVPMHTTDPNAPHVVFLSSASGALCAGMLCTHLKVTLHPPTDSSMHLPTHMLVCRTPIFYTEACRLLHKDRQLQQNASTQAIGSQTPLHNNMNRDVAAKRTVHQPLRREAAYLVHTTLVSIRRLQLRSPLCVHAAPPRSARYYKPLALQNS